MEYWWIATVNHFLVERRVNFGPQRPVNLTLAEKMLEPIVEAKMNCYLQKSELIIVREVLLMRIMFV